MVPKLLPKIMKMARKHTRRGRGFGLLELKEWDMENIEEDRLHIITERLNMACRRRRGLVIRMTGYNYKLIAPWIARVARSRGSGIRMTGYNHNPFRMFTAENSGSGYEKSKKDLKHNTLRRQIVTMAHRRRIRHRGRGLFSIGARVLGRVFKIATKTGVTIAKKASQQAMKKARDKIPREN